MPEQLSQLPTEAANPRSANLDELSTLEMLQLINDEDATIASAVRLALPQIAEAIDAISARFSRGGRLFYIGAGTSGRLGVLDASECPPTFSVPPGLFVGLIAGGDSALRKSSEQSEDSPEQGAADLAPFQITAADSLLGIAASGRTPYVLGALNYANSIGALTVALTCAGVSHDDPTEGSVVVGAVEPARLQLSKMAAIAQIPIELATGPEILTGSTRLKAGTATKLVLNMISTGVMVRQGAVYGNLMINVQPTNAKLIDRAQRIIMAATACDQPTAARLLTEAGNVKTAILMQKLGLPYAAAKARLNLAAGSLRKAINP
jgi:N-acetylmuramic acid 6-phosphate etherase